MLQETTALVSLDGLRTTYTGFFVTLTVFTGKELDLPCFVGQRCLSEPPPRRLPLAVKKHRLLRWSDLGSNPSSAIGHL